MITVVSLLIDTVIILYLFLVTCTGGGGNFHYKGIGGGVTSIIKVYTDVRLEWVYFSGLPVYEWVSFLHQKYISGVSFSHKKYMNG